METVFDVRTGFLLLGILAAASAAGGYATLRASLHRGNLLWLASGLCFGAGGVLLALRGSIADVLSFELAHGSVVAGLLGQCLAVRQEGRPRLRQGRRTLGLVVGVPLLSVVAFAGVRRIDAVWGIVYFAMAVGVSAASVVTVSLRLWRRGGHRGAAIIALTFGVLTAAMAGRVVGAFYSVWDEPAFEPGVNQFVMLAAAFFTLVLGQVGYLGMQFERIAKGRLATERQAAVLTERARQTQLREEALRELVEGRNQLIQRLARHESASELARFAMDLPHQLSQPLCASKLNLEQVMDRLAASHPDPDVLQALKAVDASNDRVLQLLQQLRILMAHHDASEHRELELGALIAQTVPILQGSFRDRGVALEVVPAADPVWVHASTTQMQKLVLILCVNALTLLQAAPRDPAVPPSVRIALGLQGDEVLIVVEDSGPGSPRPQPPAERIDVGLAIATRIAQAHRGLLSAADGSRPGATAFRLSLPRLSPPQ